MMHEAIRLMNDSEFGLTASLWTRDIDARVGRIGARHRDRDGVHEPRRLPRPGAVLDRLQEHRARAARWAVIGYHNLTPAEILSSQESHVMSLTGNWSYPTAIRFGAGRIAELARGLRASRDQEAVCW